MSESICRYSFYSLPSTSLPSLPLLLSSLTSLSNSYIFHSPTPPSLTYSPTPIPHYKGSLDVTDSIDDEWFLVSLLVQLSTSFPDLAVTVEDEDGSFLLIEGAEELPTWVTPDNADNRVWLHRGSLHLIPLSHSSSLPFPSSPQTPHLDLLPALSSLSPSTLAPPSLQSLIFNRSDINPNNEHWCCLYLPRDIAIALDGEERESGKLVAEAVKRFYERGPEGMKACTSMSRFPPTSPLLAFSPSPLPETILYRTRLTKPLYAQLMLQKFFPPKVFEKVGWMGIGEEAEEEVRRGLGMKLACGFEMAYSLTKSLPRSSSSTSSTTPAPATNDPLYTTFITQLTSSGYFQSELQGSLKYTSLESRAKEIWLAELSTKSAGERYEKGFAERVDDAVIRFGGEMKNRVRSKEEVKELNLDSGTEWLYLNGEELENLLRSRGPGEGLEKEFDEEGEEEATKMEAVRLEKLAGGVEGFVDGMGGLEGAMFDDERSDEDSSDEEEEPKPLTEEEKSTRLQTLVPPLPSPEWGSSTQSPFPPPPSLPTDPPSRASRPPKLTSNKYDGASSSSDLSSDEEEDGLKEEDEDEDEPAIVGEEEGLDMEEEVDEFLKFATETLGLSKEDYEKILGERKGRGAFVPGPVKAKKTNVGPPPSTKSTPKPTPAPVPDPTTSAQAIRNPNLRDFDTLMEQMEKELEESRKGKMRFNPTASGSGSKTKTTGEATTTTHTKTNIKTNTNTKPDTNTNTNTSTKKPYISTSSDSDNEGSEPEDEEEDEDMEMQAELSALLRSSQAGGVTNPEDPIDYNLVKNFLASFEAQGGYAGPAGNLVGRLGLGLGAAAGEGMEVDE